jgi:hypothetical protein
MMQNFKFTLLQSSLIFFPNNIYICNSPEKKAMQLSSLLSRFNEPETLKMAKLGRELRAKGIDITDMSLGEPDFDTPTLQKKLLTIITVIIRLLPAISIFAKRFAQN